MKIFDMLLAQAMGEGGGGGGGGDFSTATLTIVNTSSALNGFIRVANAFDYTEMSMPDVGTDASETVIVTVILYKGKALYNIDSDDITSANVSGSGDIEASVMGYIAGTITGDCTLTIADE